MRGIILDPNSYNGIKRLSLEQKWELLDAIYIYNMSWEIIEMSDMAWIVFDMMRWFFDTQKIKYKDKCDKNAENWRLWWRPKKETEWKRTVIEKSERLKIKPMKSNEIKWNQIELNKTNITKEKEKYQEWTTRYNFYDFLENHKNLDMDITEKEIGSINKKILEFREKLWEDKARLVLESFIEHHRTEETVIKTVVGRLNTFLINRIWK